MSFVIIDKKSLDIVTDYTKIAGNENNYFFIERPYFSLSKIWEIYKAPFIAQNNEGYFVLIENDINIQKMKYNGNIFGKIDKKLSNLILKNKSQRIYDFGKWTFITLFT